ncbi:MAG: hypothetical protein JNK40_08880 [Chromatiales bacterium]|nr:hypothetical protein [Chromatiales bacterium]
MLFALLCTAVLLPRLGGPHLHLCLDGSAPPIALHVSDAGAEAGDGHHEAGSSHEDQTVDVSSPVLGKVWPPGLDSALILVLALFLCALHGVLLPLSGGMPVPVLPLFLRPPLRGPPA